MLTQDEAVALLEKSGALLTGHFILTSGLHSDRYVEKFRLLERPEYCSQFAASMAERFHDAKPTVVVGPAMGGIILAYEVARALNVRMAFPERVDGKFSFRRGFEFSESDRILAVEDIVTTGGSIAEVLETLNALPGNVVGLGLICDRSGGKVNFPVDTYAVCTLNIQAWKADNLPQHLVNTQAIKPGSRNLQ
ncbi:MAG: orotate phosphoribosyltransferase [bacterium]|nr:orotate phosphoribosyltransferase [bacterium]